MSMYLEFEPNSWYMGFAIKHNTGEIIGSDNDNSSFYTDSGYIWEAYTDDGNTYSIVELEADTLKELKAQIRQYHIKAKNGYGERIAIRALKGGK